MNNTAVDRKTLAWIKEGVDETLQFAQDALTEFSENVDDTSPIKICISALHRVSGAAEMVEIEGAKLLANEMKLLACALVDNKVSNKQDAAEVLAAGMFQLTGYLESLYHGQPDVPLVLLPLLNDCRTCQNKELFTEGDFLTPDLSISMSSAAISQKEAVINSSHNAGVTNNISALAKRLRPGYLSGLLGVLKKENEGDNLKKLTFVLNKLLNASTTSQSEQLWWVALGIVDSLQDSSIKPCVSVKRLLARIDRQIKRVITSGEQALTDEPPTKIIKNILYYISQSKTADNRVGDIKKTFQLYGPSSETIVKSRESLYGFNVNMVDRVSTQLHEELNTIRDALDVALHSNGGRMDGLEPILDNFSIIKETLNMLGMKKESTIISDQVEFLQPKIGLSETLTDEDFMRVATALLHIESAITNLATAIHQPHNEDSISPAEHQRILEVVSRELLTVIHDIKNAVNEYSIEPSKISVLGNIPDDLKQIANVMKAIGDEQQSNLANAMNQYVCQELILNKSAESSFKLDLFADAITGLENYYQAMIEESVGSECGLQVASQSITDLGYPPAQMIKPATSHYEALLH